MNHGHDAGAYGLWSLVIINSALFIIFAFSFFKPKSKRDWRAFGSFSAFILLVATVTRGALTRPARHAGSRASEFLPAARPGREARG